MTTALKFPVPPSPVTMGAGPRARRVCEVRDGIGRLLNRLRVPGCIRPVEFIDETTGRHIKVTTGSLFTRISVDGRDYYFRRISGRYDGSGMGCG